jgi:transposase
VREAKRHAREVFMPLAFEPGEEAQVDWHEGWIEENGVERKAQFFCVRMCYSKASFVWPYERANLESFLDGHVRAFAYFGGVPLRRRSSAGTTCVPTMRKSRAPNPP